MKKEKVYIEYPLNGSSGSVIWNAIGTSHGLEAWFADKVETNNKHYSFTWGNSETRTAVVTGMRSGVFIRFRWDDEEPYTFFEMRLDFNELTGKYVLEISDFAESDEVDDMKNLWDSQVETLRRLCGL